MDKTASSFDPMRIWVATHVRRAVTGRNGTVRHRDLFATEGERWFDDDAVIRRVHADSAMFVGGLRALLLQSLHPLAMAGVAEHSDYRTDPWHRLQRTADFLAATTYGPATEAERAVARVARRARARASGIAPDGRPYAANDPHLLRWVHVAEVDSFLAAHQRYGEAPLLARRARRVRPRHGRDRARPRRARAARVGASAARPDPLPSGPNCAAPPRLATRRATCCSSRRCTRRSGRCTRVLGSAAVALLPRWARWPLRLPSFRSSRRWRCARQATRSFAACVGR